MALKGGGFILSCNFDVVVGGSEHSVYLLCHLDQNSVGLFLLADSSADYRSHFSASGHT